MEYIILGMGIVIIVLLILVLFNSQKKNDFSELRNEVSNSIKNMSEMIGRLQEQAINVQDVRLKELNEKFVNFTNETNLKLNSFEERFNLSAQSTQKKMEAIRETVEIKLTKIQNDNNDKLDKMREVVDEKLQKTLEDRIGKSFKLVSERLEEVYKGLGEMKNLASGVGDLKKVLSNVKTRGILGEIQLGAILEQILSPEQYETNFPVKQGSRDVVEYAIKLPGNNDEIVYLPIDAKFPVDVYNNLNEAYENGDSTLIENAKKAFVSRIKSFAKDIHDKYIYPPQTTDFAIMFLPVEGLYAEVVRSGLVETLQREYKVNIAGPTTIVAFLQSLQMGFKTLAIQKRSGEVFDVLGAVKTEFSKFSSVIKQAQQRLDQANGELEKLVGVRTRAIQRKLNSITSLNEEATQKILDINIDEQLESEE